MAKIESMAAQLRRIEEMLKAHLIRDNETSGMPSVPLNGLLHALECHRPMLGIVCCSFECEFQVQAMGMCGLKQAVLREGRCSQYKPGPASEEVNRQPKSQE